VPATHFETYGLGLDHHFEKTRTYFLIQGELLDSQGTRSVGLLTNNVSSSSPLAPNQPSTTPQTLDYEEKTLVVAVNQLVGTDWAFGVAYKLTDADLNSSFSKIPSSAFLLQNPNQDVNAWLNQVNIYAIYQHSCGFFAQFDAIWSQQTNEGYSPAIQGDDFWQFNIFAGYRFFQRRAEARIGLVNLTDRNYQLNPLTLYNELPRERMLTLSFKFNF